MDASGPFRSPPVFRRFLQSRFGRLAFLAFMVFAVWSVGSQLLHSLSAPVVHSRDFDFIVLVTFLCWSMVTRRDPFWKRWALPSAAAIVCWVLAEMAAKNLTINLTRQEGSAATFYLAMFYSLIVLWVAIFPIEELDYDGGAARRGRLRFRPVAFAMAGAAMVTVAGARFSAHLRSLVNHGGPGDLIAARNVATYLSLALFVLAVERITITWPIDRSNAQGIVSSTEQRV